MNNQKTNPRRSINCIMSKLTGNHRFETLKMPISDRVGVLFTICAKCLSNKVEIEVGRLKTTKSISVPPIAASTTFAIKGNPK
jgi:hypothetical protein